MSRGALTRGLSGGTLPDVPSGTRRDVAKPVQFRHSPATVNRRPATEVRSPTRGGCTTFEREAGSTMHPTD